MKHFVPISPDPYLKKRKGDGALARFGHLNVIVDKINEFDANQTINGGPVLTPTALVLGLNIVTPTVGNDAVVLPCLSEICACSGGCGPTGPVIIKNVGVITLNVYACGTESINGGPGPVAILAGDSLTIVDSSCTSWETINSAAGSPGAPGPPPCVEASAIQAPTVTGDEVIKGTGVLGDCLSVCIDGTTIIQNAEGCLMVDASALPPSPASLGYAEYVQYTQAPNNSVASGLAFELLTDNALGVFNTAGITTAGAPTQGTAFFLLPGFYMVDYETSTSSVGPLAISQGLTNVLPSDYTADINTKAGSTTATTWIHGRGIVESSVALGQWFIVGPTDSVTAAVTTTGGAPEYIVRVTFLKIA